MSARVRIALVAAAVLAFMVIAATPAFAVTHVTHDGVFTSELWVSLDSTGDAGSWAGNEFIGTSPVAPSADPGNFYWFNQKVMIGDPSSGLVTGGIFIADSLDGDDDIAAAGGSWIVSKDGKSWSAPSEFTVADLPILSAEGIYSVVATGTDPDVPGVAQGTIGLPSGFGIDMTRPRSWTDLPDLPSGHPGAIATFSEMATVTITATDTLSGVERLQYSVDGGPFDFTHDAEVGTTFRVPVAFGLPGFHTLAWHMFDNAGNIESHSVSFIIRPAGFKPSVALRVSQSGYRKRRVTFSGAISTMPSPTMVQVKVLRKVRSRYVNFAAYSVSVPANVDDFRFTKTITRAGVYRVTAYAAGGRSTTRTFTVR